jgi:hypothetical protein
MVTGNQLKIFKDKALTQEVKTLDFGIVPAGETRKYEFYIHNDTKAWIRELELKVGHPEVRVIDGPTELESGDSGVLVLEWTPSLTVMEGLKVRLCTNYKALWRPN